MRLVPPGSGTHLISTDLPTNRAAHSESCSHARPPPPPPLGVSMADAHRGAAQPLLVPTSKCSSNALALGLGLGLGLGLPLLLAILVYSYWFYSRRAKPQDRADARSQGGTSQV
jgi:hypothetical protein